MSLGQASGLLGTKEKIQQSFRIKEEADKALEKLPEDAATHFLLGKWCLGVCSLGCAPPSCPQPPAQQPSSLSLCAQQPCRLYLPLPAVPGRP